MGNTRVTHRQLGRKLDIETGRQTDRRGGRHTDDTPSDR